MASSFLKTCSFICYGVVTVALLCAVLVLIFKDDKSCPKQNISASEINKLLDLTNDTASSSSDTAEKREDEPEFKFEGEYELISSDNFDEFLSELGIGYFTRLAATQASSRYFIIKNGPRSYTLRTESTFGTSTITFEDGVPFKEDRLDGETVTSTVTIKGNKWIQEQKGDGLKVVHIVREFSPEQVKVTSMVNNVASVRIYKKVA